MRKKSITALVIVYIALCVSYGAAAKTLRITTSQTSDIEQTYISDIEADSTSSKESSKAVASSESSETVSKEALSVLVKSDDQKRDTESDKNCSFEASDTEERENTESFSWYRAETLTIQQTFLT